MSVDVAIIGAGAAGCFCAIELRRRHPELEVKVYEAGSRPLAKVALTGGGRCNLTNSFRDVRRLTEVYPRGERLMKRALSEFSQEDTVKWFENEGVRLVVQDDQCVFPASQDAMQIVRTLEREMRVEGHYTLPQLAVMRVSTAGAVDTLLFDAMEMEVKTMPVDTATFVLHDIKGQMRYPLTFKEIFPWIAGAWLVIVLGILTVALILSRKRNAADVAHCDDPAHIVALRRLDKFRSNAYWAPEKQKAFYSGITDALKDYIEARFGIDAPEMTSAELFDALKTDKDITPEMFAELRELFERADFVKFAKHAATDEENASALPTAVRFVTSTYKVEPEEGQEKDVL